MAFQIDGITRDNNGNLTGSADVFLLKYNSSTHVFTQIAHTTSNAITGAFSFASLADNDTAYNIVAFKDGTPHSFDVSDRNLQPYQVGGWATPADAANLQYWFDASASASCYTDAGTTLCTNATRIYRFADQSGHGCHLQQTTAGSRPMFNTSDTINGLQAIRVQETDGIGGGAQNMSIISAPTITGNCITFTVFQPTLAYHDTPNLWVDNRLVHFQTHVGEGTVAVAISWAAATAAHSTINPITIGQKYASYVKSSTTALAIKVTGDSAEVSANQAMGDNSGFTLGPWDPANTASWLNVLIGESFTIAPYTQADVDGATAYLTAKWGVAP